MDGQFQPGNTLGAATTKLTPERHENIVKLLGQGNFLSTSARASGISPRQLRKWLKRGQSEHRSGQDTDRAKLYRDVREASAKCEAELVASIRTAALGVKGEVVTKTIKPLLGPDGLPRMHKDGSPIEVTETRIEVSRLCDWRAAARLLESRSRSRFGTKASVNVAGRVDHVVRLSPEDERIAASIANRRLAYTSAAVVDARGTERSLPGPEDLTDAKPSAGNVVDVGDGLIPWLE